MIDSVQLESATLPGARVLQRIEALTLGFGAAAALCAILMLRRVDWAEGLLGGAVLGWLNFRWLRRGILAMFQAAVTHAAQRPAATEENASGESKTAFSAGTYFTLLFRYALVGLGVYVIFSYLHVPLVSIGLGLCALVAAIMAASVWEVVTSWK
jgi:hypothetical protein